MNRINTILLLFSTIIFILWIYLVNLRADLFIAGIPYIKTVQDTEVIRKENLLLKEELLRKSAYTYIEAEARKRGFIDAPIERME